MSILFALDSITITLPDPVPGSPVRRVGRQALGRTAAGKAYAYEKGPASHEVELRLESLTNAEKDALAAFIADTCQGCLRPFTYTDSAGVARAARLLNPQLEFTKVCANVWDVRLHLELSDMGG